MFNAPSFDITQIFSLIFGGLGQLWTFLIGSDGFQNFWAAFYPVYREVATYVTLILLTGVIYSTIRLGQLRTEEHDELHHSERAFQFGAEKRAEPGVIVPSGQARWQSVEKHIMSPSSSDWRLAILEADIILDELVRALNPVGDNLGERLKGIARGDFQTLDKAWEAHKIRNAIAHEGANFTLSEHEAKRIIKLFEEVFREFNYI